MKRRLILLALLASPLTLAKLVAGCSAESVGEPCSVLNNSDDCATGLVCTPAAELGGNSDICCLSPIQENTVPACIPGGLNNGGSSATGGTGGTGGATSSSSTGGTGGTGGGTGGTGGAVAVDPVISQSPSSAFEYDTHLAVAPSGDVFVTWLGSPPPPDGGTAATFVGYAVSSDAGQSFASSGTVDTPGGRFADHPTLAVDSQNNVYLAWVGYVAGSGGAPTDTHVYVAVAPAGAKTFNAPVEASDPTGGYTYQNPRVLVTPSGNPLVVYQRSGSTDLGIVAARSTDGGMTWSTNVVAVDPHLLDDRDLPAPCASSITGRIYATYFYDDPAVGTGVGIGWSDDDGVTWIAPDQTPEVDQPDPSGNFPARSTPQCVAVESSVRVLYGVGQSPAVTGTGEWQEFQDLAYAVSDDDGESFVLGNAALVSAIGSLLNPQFIADPAGGYDLVFYQGKATMDSTGTYVWGRSSQPMPFAFTPSTTIATVDFDTSRTDETRLGDYTGLGATSTQLFTSYAKSVDGTSHIRVHVAPLK